MARAVKPTYKQKVIMNNQNLKVKDWLVSKETEIELKLVNKASGKTRTLKKLAMAGTKSEQIKKTKIAIV